VIMRIQRLKNTPEPAVVLAAIPEEGPEIVGERMHRSGPTVETIYSEKLDLQRHGVEVSYEGSYELDEPALADGSILDQHFSAIGGWISSTLVKLGDLKLDFLAIEES